MLTIQSKSPAKYLVGQLDMLGDGMCKLGNSLALRSIASEVGLTMAVSAAETGEELDEEQASELKKMKETIKIMQQEREIFGVLIQCLRDVRDGVARANGIPEEQQYLSAEFMAEMFCQDMDQDGYTLPEEKA